MVAEQLIDVDESRRALKPEALTLPSLLALDELRLQRLSAGLGQTQQQLPPVGASRPAEDQISSKAYWLVADQPRVRMLLRRASP